MTSRDATVNARPDEIDRSYALSLADAIENCRVTCKHEPSAFDLEQQGYDTLIRALRAWATSVPSAEEVAMHNPQTGRGSATGANATLHSIPSTGERCEHGVWKADHCWQCNPDKQDSEQPRGTLPSSIARQQGETPRTDAKYREVMASDYGQDPIAWSAVAACMVAFAVQLERELAAAKIMAEELATTKVQATLQAAMEDQARALERAEKAEAELACLRSVIARRGDRRNGTEERRSGKDRRVTLPKNGDPMRRMFNRRRATDGDRRAYRRKEGQ